MTDQTPVADLPLQSAGPFDSVVGVEESTGNARRFPMPVAGSPTAYEAAADLPGGAAEGTPAYVIADATTANNGLWGVISGTWTKMADPGTAQANSLSLFPRQSASSASETAAFARVKKLELYGADPTKFYSVKYLFWKDTGTRFTFTIVEHDDVDGTSAAEVASYSISSGADSWDGPREIALAQVSSSGITGTAILDFTDSTALTVNTASGSTATYQRRSIAPRVIANSAARTSNIGAQIDAAIEASPDISKVPFAEAVTAVPIRNLVKSVHLYGCDPSHEYAFSVLTVETFANPLTRLRVTIRDLTDSVDVCAASTSVASQPGFATFIADVPSIIKASGNGVTPKTRAYAVVEFDWDAVSDFFSYGSSTMALAGIAPECVYPDEAIADYLDADRWHEVIRVGSAETYTTLRAAVEATYSDLTGSSAIFGAPVCDRAHYHHRVLIDIVEDGEYEATFLKIPDYVEVRGTGLGRTIIVRENTNADAMIEAHVNHKFRDCTLVSETAGEYCIHSDNANGNTLGGIDQAIRLRQSFKRMHLKAEAGHNGWVFGCGISSGEEIRFEDCVVEHVDSTATQPAWGIHNTGPTASVPATLVSYKPAQVTMRGCSSPDQLAVLLQTVDPSAICSLTLLDCQFRLIGVEISSGTEVQADLAVDRNAWRIGGRYDGAFSWTDAGGSTVLKTTAGQTPSGDAAALIFGTVDEHGRGEKWLKDSTDYSLGARLGDCSSVNKELTIGAQTHTFTTDLTAVNNATIVAAINGSLTTHPVSIVDIGLEWVPDASPKRRVRNSTGSTIDKGVFVRFTGAGTVAPCGANERPEGWTHRAILNGDDGYVLLTRRIHQNYITGASSSSGEWGITTSGLLDYSASTKLGRTIGGIVEVY